MNPPATSITLNASDETAFWGDVVTFIVRDNYGVNITSDATIYVDGSEISGTSITSNSDATFQCYAVFEELNLTSETITVSFSEPPPTFVKNVLVEDYTGTWCGWCPRVNLAIESVEEETEHAFAVGIHVSDEMSSRVNTSILRNTMGVNSFPTAKIDRTVTWQSPENENVNQVTQQAGREEQMGLAINTSLNGNTITAEVKVSYSQDYSQDLELVVYLVEDDLQYDQANNYPDLYGGVNPLANFTHNGVLSDVYTNILGDAMPEGVAGDEYTKSFSESVPSFIQNTDEIYIVAFVINADTNTCFNAQRVKVGENKDYEYFN